MNLIPYFVKTVSQRFVVAVINDSPNIILLSNIPRVFLQYVSQYIVDRETPSRG